MERPSYSAGSLKIVIALTFFFAVGCASESYVVCFFVGRGGEGVVYCFLLYVLVKLLVIFLYVLAIQNRFSQVQIQKHFPKNIYLVSKFSLKYSVLFTFT